MARSETVLAISLAKHVATDASSGAGKPWPALVAARWISSRAASTWLTMSASDPCTLELGDVLAELLALLHVGGRTVQARLADRKRVGGVAEPPYGERGEQLVEAAFVDDQVLDRNPDVVEEHVGRADAPMPHQLLLGTEGQPGGALGHDDRADALATRLGAEPDVDEVLLGVPGAGAPPFGAVDDDLVAADLSAGDDVRGRGAGPRLGDRDGDGHFARGDRWQQPGFLLLGNAEVAPLRVGEEHTVPVPLPSTWRVALMGQLAHHRPEVQLLVVEKSRCGVHVSTINQRLLPRLRAMALSYMVKRLSHVVVLTIVLSCGGRHAMRTSPTISNTNSPFWLTSVPRTTTWASCRCGRRRCSMISTRPVTTSPARVGAGSRISRMPRPATTAVRPSRPATWRRWKTAMVCTPLAMIPPKGPDRAAAGSMCMSWGSQSEAKAMISSSLTRCVPNSTSESTRRSSA